MKNRGFTLIEILIAIALLAILLGVVIVAINPVRRFEEARDTRRWRDVAVILDAIYLNILDNDGDFNFDGCPAGNFPGAVTEMQAGAGNADICGCLVPKYIASMPFDPKRSPVGAEHYYTDCNNYKTGYRVKKETIGNIGVITISAPYFEVSGPIQVSR